LAFVGKTTPYGKNFENFVTKVFIATQMDVLCSNYIKFGRREIGAIVRYLPDKNTKFRLALQLSLLLGSRPKSANESAVATIFSALDPLRLCAM